MPEVATMSPTDYLASTRAWSLRALVMNDCSATRGPGSPESPGSVHAERSVTNHADGLSVGYSISQETSFLDQAGELIAVVNVSYLVVYDTGAAEPSAELVKLFTPSAIMHVTPFLREFIATMTNRLALPPYYLPLVREDEIQVETASE